MIALTVEGFDLVRIAGILGWKASPTTTGWEGRALGLVVLVCGLPIVFYVLTHPALLRRRLRIGLFAEPEFSQKIIVSALQLCLVALVVISGLDHASGWSNVPVAVVLIGDLSVAAGQLLVFLVFRANPFAAATVNVETEQTVISSGPYAFVRHPMYSGILLLSLGIPVALGSWWGLVFYLPLLATIILRLKNEERYLSKRLPGYQDYCAKVAYRLIPRIW